MKDELAGRLQERTKSPPAAQGPEETDLLDGNRTWHRGHDAVIGRIVVLGIVVLGLLRYFRPGVQEMLLLRTAAGNGIRGAEIIQLPAAVGYLGEEILN